MGYYGTYTAIVYHYIVGNTADVNLAHAAVDDINDLKARVDRVRNLRSLKQIDFLKYHKLGVGKYRELGLRYPLENIGEVSDELLAEIREYAGDIVTTIGG